MKAIVYTQYGAPDVLQYRDVAQPVPERGEVLTRSTLRPSTPATGTCCVARHILFA